MLIAEQRRWQNSDRKREGGTERERKRASVCERETDVTAKNNQYNLRWWKEPCCSGLSLKLTLWLASCKSVRGFGKDKLFQTVVFSVLF